MVHSGDPSGVHQENFEVEEKSGVSKICND